MRTINEQLTLKPATVSDTDFARVVHHAALRDVVVRQFGTWDEQVQEAFFEDDWEPDEFEIIVFEGIPCGYLRVEHLSTHVEIHEINIEPEHQRSGIGTRILKDIMTMADGLALPV